MNKLTALDSFGNLIVGITGAIQAKRLYTIVYSYQGVDGSQKYGECRQQALSARDAHNKFVAEPLNAYFIVRFTDIYGE